MDISPKLPYRFRRCDCKSSACSRMSPVQIVATPLLQESYKLVGVVAERFLKEFFPKRTIGFFIRRNSCKFRDAIRRVRFSKQTGAQIDRTSRVPNRK